MKTLEKLAVKLQPNLIRHTGQMPCAVIDSLKVAIRSMYVDSHVDFIYTEKGYVDHTWEMITLACSGSGELWLATLGQEIVGFLLAAYSKEVDNEPTFVIRQAWVSQKIRRNPAVKQMLGRILSNAKMNFAKHVLIVSSRNPNAYIRWLGKGWKKITTVIKGDL